MAALLLAASAACRELDPNAHVHSWNLTEVVYLFFL
eukprot:CAMPEP_0113324332 /NCGR_PEP_ID=MMETSP0010_2-20120614/16967_1 /TAXON_ID=216773 ORGANISM="Corethron hystrix, Strain 308" /NCGR_SAMPLE_ID=MMETSP0010_2 /ASSEMBLY_ACC=CAM_ASM_000155 /LENGTH=35 /DNA_ID=CAMNT_0000183661 /DNA_START=341 /DNA_END=445 /DNA_ORIENTATION=- /assembly_acc=CAM_ASM_000155